MSTSWRDQMNSGEVKLARRRISILLGAGALLQGAQYALRPDYPRAVFPALAFDTPGWVIFGALIAACGLTILTVTNSWPAHLLSACCFVLLGIGQATSPTHSAPFVLGTVGGMHIVQVMSAFDVRRRLGAHWRRGLSRGDT